MTLPVLTRLVNAAFPALNAAGGEGPGKITAAQAQELAEAIAAAKAWLAQQEQA